MRKGCPSNETTPAGAAECFGGIGVPRQSSFSRTCYNLQRGIDGTLVDALVRRDGGSQVALHPGERRANVLRAFSRSSRREISQSIRDRDGLLVDDVLTTGATSESAPEVLGSGGAQSVVIFTFARALPA